VAAPSLPVVTDPPELLVDDAWAPDPLEPDGDAELRRRLLAEPRYVPRTELEGHVGLSARELFELGCTLAPIEPLGILAAARGRMLVVGGALLLACGLAGALGSTLGPLLDGWLGTLGDPDPVSPGESLLVAGVFLAAAAGGWALIVRSVRALRTQAAERRTTRPGQRRHPAEDPQARTTVAVLPGPDAIRVQLLWLRADPADPARVELRTLAEQRFRHDESVRAEDAVVRFSDVGLRADAARGLVAEHGTRALAEPHPRAESELASAARGPLPEYGARPLAGNHPATGGEGAPSTVSGMGPAGPAGPAGPRGVSPRTAVSDGWELDPLTEAGEAELARRLCLARPKRWGADKLAPLVRAGAATGPYKLPVWPGGRELAYGVVPAPLVDFLNYTGAVAVVVWLFTLGASEDPTATIRLISYGALAVALSCGPLVFWSARRTPGQRLLRRLHGAASAAPRALEQGIPGAGGQFLVARGAHGDGERLALLHVRPVPVDGRPGTVEVRRLAWRDAKHHEAVTPHDVALQLRLVADAAEFLGERGSGSGRQLRGLAAGLGRAGARAAERSSLVREPLMWLAAPIPPLLVLAAVNQTNQGTWLEDGLTLRILSFAWPLAIALILVVAARRIRDPWAG
jgi:hypothetical protein